MKALLLVLVLTQNTDPDWKRVVTGSNVEISVAEIARGPKQVKFWLRFDFPDGAPDGVFPVHGVSSVRTEATFNCVKRTAKLTNGYGFFYDKEGNLIKKAKDRQTVKAMPDSVGQYILEYFCEQLSAPVKTAPKLKPK
jgi:hypothetical protein